ncbi:MAG: 3'(2'),5'-bisphosphate nucleotidase [Pirellulaceae bacterium]
MANTWQQELEVAVTAVSTAAKLCRRVQSSADFAELAKADRSPVTVADFGSQALVCREILAHFSTDLVIGEEGSEELRQTEQATLMNRVLTEVQKIVPDATTDQVLAWIDAGDHRDPAERAWTLDPIDGTKGFLRGEQYAVALALLIDGQVTVAAMACPNLISGDGQHTGLLFTAVRGRGANVRPLEHLEHIESVRVTETASSQDAVLCESVESDHSDHGRSASLQTLLGINKPSVRMDSQAKYATVARGQADIYLRLPTSKGYQEKIWDHAAGCLVIEEAGGKVTDITGQPLDFSRGSTLSSNSGIIATNGHLHAMVVAAIQNEG